VSSVLSLPPSPRSFALQSKYKTRYVNPCFTQFERLAIAMEATNCNYLYLHKYATEVENCMKANPLNIKSEKKTTMYQLNKYLDQKKNKVK
jgi:hypothetical protein